MTHKRLKLSRFLHFTDTDPSQHNKKLHKIKPILDYINTRFSAVYTPEKDVVIDESLLLWKGQLSFLQFIQIKHARFGIKTYIQSESTSGYICKLVIYTGKDTELIIYPDYGHGTKVVLT